MEKAPYIILIVIGVVFVGPTLIFLYVKFGVYGFFRAREMFNRDKHKDSFEEKE